MILPDNFFLWMLMDPAHPSLVGALNSLTDGDVSLTYAPSWIKSGFALSADMPLGANEYRPGNPPGRKERSASGAVDDARPDSWGEKVIRTLHKPGNNRLVEYLYYAGDNRFGALGVSSSNLAYQPFQSIIPSIADAPAISRIAKAIEAGDEIGEQQRLLADAGASLGGAKPKAAISIHGDPFILKLFNGEHVDQPLIEHATTELARKAGIDAARTILVRLAGENAIAVKRFDRNRSGRIHCVSAATVLKAENPNAPLFGYPHLARALRKLADRKTVQSQLHELFRRMAFNILVANTDDHERNHAMKSNRGVLELAPAYDLVPTGSGATDHQLLIGEDSREANLNNALGVCAQFAHTEQTAFDEIVGVIGVVDGWKAHFKQWGVSDNDIDQLESVIDQDALKLQRREFGKGIVNAPPRRKNKPFRNRA